MSNSVNGEGRSRVAVRIARVSLLLVAAAAGLGRLSVALEGRGRARRALGVAMLLAYETRNRVRWSALYATGKERTTATLLPG